MNFSRYLRQLSFILLSSLVLTGCATFPFLSTSPQERNTRPVPILVPYKDYRGVAHVHSRYSHDSKGRFDAIVRSARKANADFVWVTDHNTVQGIQEKMDGFYGDTLVLVGAEWSTRSGHLLSVGTERDFNRHQETAQLLTDIESSGGMSFIAHGESARKAWDDWTLAPVQGLEIYNLAADIYDDGKLGVGMRGLVLPPKPFFKSVIDRPDKELARWDELLARGRYVGIGSVDAHQKVRVLGLALDSYKGMFKVVQTHVWASNLSKGAVLEALQKGHVYVGFDVVKPIRNFLFAAQGGGLTYIMGDQVELSEDLVLRVFLPDDAHIKLLHNGNLVAEEKDSSLLFEVKNTGVYRVEVYRGRRLWILSNPIYVVPA